MRRYRFLWLLLLAYFGYLLWPQLRSAVGMGAQIGNQVPAFRVQALDGRRFDSGAMTGQVVLVNFWATWCEPCRTEMPMFEQVYRDFHQRGFEIIAISLDETGVEHVARYAADLALSFPVIAEQGQVARQFDGSGVVPVSYLIDRQGRIRRKMIGSVHERSLRAAVAELLTEPDRDRAAQN